MQATEAVEDALRRAVRDGPRLPAKEALEAEWLAQADPFWTGDGALDAALELTAPGP